MKCVFCKGDLSSLKPMKHVADFEDTIIIFRNVPTRVCTQCGEKFYDTDVAQKIENVSDKYKDIELVILDYNKIN